eukprot:1254995-Alexandrium_andersonii.AAC.1
MELSDRTGAASRGSLVRRPALLAVAAHPASRTRGGAGSQPSERPRASPPRREPPARAPLRFPKGPSHDPCDPCARSAADA